MPRMLKKRKEKEDIFVENGLNLTDLIKKIEK